MSKWTQQEREALELTAHLSGIDGYKKFVELGGGDKSFDSWEVKRRRIQQSIPRYTVSTSGPTVPVAEYKGWTVGFFDIETTFSMQPIILYAAIADEFGRVTEFRKSSEDITDDAGLVASLAEALEQYDMVVSWNGKLFDVPVIQARLAFNNLPRLNLNTHLDLMYYATGQFMRMGRKSLQSVSEYFDTANAKTPLKVRQWDGAMSGKTEDYEAIVEHCNADVLVLRDVFPILKRHVRNIHRAG